MLAVRRDFQEKVACICSVKLARPKVVEFHFYTPQPPQPAQPYRPKVQNQTNMKLLLSILVVFHNIANGTKHNAPPRPNCAHDFAAIGVRRRRFVSIYL
jgi:hypothetical protein